MDQKVFEPYFFCL